MKFTTRSGPICANRFVLKSRGREASASLLCAYGEGFHEILPQFRSAPPYMQGSPPVMVPPKLDWDRPPWNRWAFQHIREILPTAEVCAAMAIATVSNAPRWISTGWRSGQRGRPTTLAGLLDETYTDGFLVLKDGKVAYERYFNGMGERTLHLSQSMAKSVTGSVSAYRSAAA